MPFSIHKMPFYSVSPTINMDVKKSAQSSSSLPIFLDNTQRR